jgi:hypothetical protein
MSKEDAIALYEDFHKYDPKKVGYFNGLRIPSKVELLGEAKHVLYRSNKRDPETLRAPKRAIDYIHEHEGGVRAFRAGRGGETTVPAWIQEADGLVRLGQSLGFAYADGGETIEVEAGAPYPVLYAIPSGKALLIIEGNKVLAMIWGGNLDVRPEGIVG